MSNIQWAEDAEPKRNKRHGSVYQLGEQLHLQRRRVNSRDPKSAPQQADRSCVAFRSAMWRFLTPTEQASWTPNPGESLTGYYLYMSVNLLTCFAGGPLIRVHGHPSTIADLTEIIGPLSRVLAFEIASLVPGDITVDWGDGNTDTLTNQTFFNPLHTYAADGTYNVIIDDNTGLGTYRCWPARS